MPRPRPSSYLNDLLRVVDHYEPYMGRLRSKGQITRAFERAGKVGARRALARFLRAGHSRRKEDENSV